MTDLAIRVENLGKMYRIGRAQQRHDTLRDALVAGLCAPWQRLAAALHRPTEGQERQTTNDDTIWALKDVSFEVQRGEVVGIIGRNGAGKSTLLKILSRITEPTTGRAEIHGRVGSLLEVGTGFHPELTGRENIYLNGAILGMKRTEIDHRFDEIVAFAEIGKLLDTPVKRYSSGMYVRLAFAVAAHLDLEILLVDEVLAVGDAAFQKKCLSKMDDVARGGRTVLFVSHNMAAVQALCTRGIFLHQGRVWADDVVGCTVMAYLKTLEHMLTEDLLERIERRGRGSIKLTKVQISSGEQDSTPLFAGGPANFVFHITEMRAGLACTFTIYDHYGQPIGNFNSAINGREDVRSAVKDLQIACHIPELLLVPGQYRINVAIALNGELEDHVEAAAFFDVEPGQLRGRPIGPGSGYGCVCMPHRWIVSL